ncbi:MAG: autoinducer-2 kinase [Spirochaetales bacterium]|nr:autoinducer-2 kinase [Spirochaetales bacterium]
MTEKEKLLLAIDAGTGSVRAVLFNTSGKEICCVQREWEHSEDPKYPGSMNFDWEYNWELTCFCIKGVIEQSGINASSISAISTTCMREGIVLYDKDGKELWACANVDARSDDEVAYLVKKDPALEREIYKISGQTYALGALPRLLWVKNKLPNIYEKTAHLSMFNDWLIYKITGILKTEPSNGSTTGIFDLETRKWDTSIAEKIGLKTEIFPETVECGDIVGKVHAEGAKETNLAEGTIVVAGGGDAQLGSIGVGVVDNNQAAVFGGSFWQYEFNTNQCKTDKDCRVRVNCHGVPSLWQYEAIAFKPGLAMRWFRDSFCQEEVAKAKQLKTSAYELMNKEAVKIPAGCYGMMCTFSDIMNYISWKHAAPTFTNFDFDPEKFNKFTFYRAIMENTAMITKGHIELVYESTGNKPSEIVFAGGAAMSDLWCQILSDVTGLPVKVPVVKEATALGTAILAGYGVGIFKDISETARALVEWETTFTPNEENHKTYTQMYGPWREVYSAQLGLSEKRLTKFMWAAPGL